MTLQQNSRTFFHIIDVSKHVSLNIVKRIKQMYHLKCPITAILIHFTKGTLHLEKQHLQGLV